ncbi:MAG: hypothetical protein ABEI80_05905 [Haloplanus sp.]
MAETTTEQQETGGTSSPTAEEFSSAVVSEWPFWTAGVILLAGSSYFYTVEAIVPEMTAESFYAVIFAMFAVAALARGVYNVRKRTRIFGM